MPYINKTSKGKYSGALGTLQRDLPSATAGELVYVITKILLTWMGGEKNFTVYNAAIGALECAKLELYRRVIAEYEDEKREENGDVYGQG